MTVDWMARAKCRDRDDIVFFPGDGDNAFKARRFCSDCPVRMKCLEYALRHNLKDGVWGGTSPNQRKVIRKKMRST